MVPLRAATPTRSAPVLSYGLIALNAGVFAYQSWLPPEAAERFSSLFGMTPSHVLDADHPGVLLTLITNLFLHGSWFHLLSNLWCLYAFGGPVEDRLGKPRFALFFLAAGLGGGLAQALIDPSVESAMLCSSGAIAGLLGAYWKLFPQGRVLTLIPLLFVFVQEVPAVYFISLWCVLQLLAGFASLMGPGVGAVMFFAQIGGFCTGVALIWLFRPARNATSGFRKPEFR